MNCCIGHVRRFGFLFLICKCGHRNFAQYIHPITGNITTYCAKCESKLELRRIDERHPLDN